MEQLAVITRHGDRRVFDARDVHRALSDAFLSIGRLRASADNELTCPLSELQTAKVCRLVDAICEPLRQTLRPSVSVQELELRVALVLVQSFELAALRAFIFRRKRRTFLAETIEPADIWEPRSSPMHDTEHGMDGAEREHDASGR